MPAELCFGSDSLNIAVSVVKERVHQEDDHFPGLVLGLSLCWSLSLGSLLALVLRFCVQAVT